jgi:hypothetical protein
MSSQPRFKNTLTNEVCCLLCVQVPELQLPIRFATPVGGELMESLPGTPCSAAFISKP